MIVSSVFACLTTEQSNAAEAKVGELEMAVLINEEIVWLEITRKEI